MVTGIAVNLSNVTDLNHGSVTLTDGGTVDMSSVSDVDGASFFISDGVTLSLPGATTYAHAPTASNQTRSFRVEGINSVLDLSNLTSITNGTSIGSDITIDALTGGAIDLGGVTQIIDPSTGDTRARAVRITADGFGSTINLPALATFGDVNTDERSTLTPRNGGSILAGSLTELQGVHVTLNGTGTLPVAKIATFENSQATLSAIDPGFAAMTSAGGSAFVVSGIAVNLSTVTDLNHGSVTLTNGGTVDVSNVSNIDGAGFFVSDGVTLSLPAATTYSHVPTASNQTRSFRVEGSGSVLDLSNLTSITNGASFGSDITIDALTGGAIDLGGVTQIIDPSAGDTRARSTRVTADGFASTINLQALATFEDVNADERSTLTPRNGGSILAGLLTDLQGVHVTLDGTGTLPVAQIATFENSQATLSVTDPGFTAMTSAGGSAFVVSGVAVNLSNVTDLNHGSVTLTNGGTVDMSNVSNIDGASFFVSGGVTLSLPAATTYSHAATG